MEQTRMPEHPEQWVAYADSMIKAQAVLTELALRSYMITASIEQLEVMCSYGGHLRGDADAAHEIALARAMPSTVALAISDATLAAGMLDATDRPGHYRGEYVVFEGLSRQVVRTDRRETVPDEARVVRDEWVDSGDWAFCYREWRADGKSLAKARRTVPDLVSAQWPATAGASLDVGSILMRSPRRIDRMRASEVLHEHRLWTELLGCAPGLHRHAADRHESLAEDWERRPLVERLAGRCVQLAT